MLTGRISSRMDDTGLRSQAFEPPAPALAPVSMVSSVNAGLHRQGICDDTSRFLRIKSATIKLVVSAS